MKLTKKRIIVGVILGVLLLMLSTVAVYQFSPSRRMNRHIVKARISSNGGQYGTALTEYEKALAIDPGHVDALSELGFVRLALEQPDRAAEQFQRCIKLHPAFDKAWLGLVRSRLALKDIEGATAASAELLKLKRDSAALRARGEIGMARKAFDEALAAFNEASLLSPDDYEPMRQSAALLRQLKRDNEAIQRLTKFAARPDAKEREKALLTLSDIALQEDRVQDALACLDRAIAINSTPELLTHRAAVLVHLNKFEQARQDIETVFKQQPTPLPLAYKIRAACLLEKNDTDSALRDALVAQRALGDDPQVALVLARIYYKANSALQAEQEARRALILSPDYFAAQNFLMSILIDQGNYDQAIAFGRDLSRRARRNENAMRMWIRACMDGKQPDEARKALEAASSSETRDGLGFNAGSTSPLFASASAEEAIEKFNQLPPGELNTPSAQFLLGHAYLRAKKIPEAMRALERSAELDPDRAETLMTLAGIHLALGNAEMGAAQLENAVSRHPDALKAVEWLARIRMHQHKYKEADALYARLSARDSTAIAPLMNQIKAKLLSRDTDGLAELARKLEGENAPDLKALSFMVQAVLAHKKNPSEGWELLDKAIEVSPNFGPALHEKAVNCIHDGKFDAAIELFSRIENAALKPSGFPRVDFGAALLAAGQLDRARTVAAEEHLLLRNAESLMLAVAVDLKAGQPESAQKQIRAMGAKSQELETVAALAQLPKGAAICEKLVLADVFARAGRGPWAGQMFGQAASLAPDNADLAALRANALIRIGHKDQGAALLAELAAKNPQRIDFTLLLAQFNQGQGKADEAIANYKQVLAVNSQHPRALAAIGTLYLQRGNKTAAAEHLLKAIKISPQDIVSLNNYVWVTAVDLKSPDRALPFAEDLHRLAPQNAHVLDTVGWVYFLNNDFEKAEQILSHAATLAPDEPDVAYHHAMALNRNSKPSQALAELKRARLLKKTFKNSDVASRLIEELERNPLANRQ